jgi:hypothetical protein
LNFIPQFLWHVGCSIAIVEQVMRIMKGGKSVLIFGLSAALNLQTVVSIAGGAEDKTPQPKWEKQTTKPETKSKENADAEWFADPDRGWVRVDGRPGAKDDQKKTKQTVQKQKRKTAETVRHNS